MSKFQVWDIPSASLVDETDDLYKIAETVQSLIDDDGLGVLDDLSLSEELGETGQFVSYKGSDVMLSLQEHLAKDWATRNFQSAGSSTQDTRRLLLGFLGIGSLKFPWDQMRLMKAVFLATQSEMPIPGAENRFSAYSWGPFDSSLYRHLDGLAHEKCVRKAPVSYSRTVHYSLTAWGSDRANKFLTSISPEQFHAMERIVHRVTAKPFTDTLIDIYEEFPEYATESKLLKHS